ncbi:MAG TPA: hypothetical protein ENN77_01305 [Candidatus Wirthbacteria bacterium]|nr:hypothetical protein [Candidatus Wirthbacteria bacterium]
MFKNKILSCPLCQEVKKLNSTTTWAQKAMLGFGLLGLVSPFLNWFYACTIVPGVYKCTTWNGFQYDNELFGLTIFVISLLVIYNLFIRHRAPQHPYVIKFKHFYLLSGIGLFGLALYRLLSFRGQSTDITSIGPGTGLLFALIAGAGIVILNQHQALSQIKQLFNRKPTTAKPDKKQNLSTDDQIVADFLQEDTDERLAEVLPPKEEEDFPEQQYFDI